MTTGSSSGRPMRARLRGHTPVPGPSGVPLPRRQPPSTAALWTILVVVLALFSVLMGRLVDLQLISGDQLAQEAAQVSTRTVTEPAMRGRIVAADGTVLAGNEASTVITLDPEVALEAEDEGRSTIESVAQELGLPADRMWGRTRVCGTEQAPPAPLCFSGSPYRPIPLAYDVDPVDALAIVEHPEQYPGIEVASTPVRSYDQDSPNAAHLLGYLGRPTAAEVEEDPQQIQAGSLLGRAGLEQQYDQSLRGEPGSTTVAVDPRGVVTEQLSSQPPEPGLDLRTHLDASIQGEVEQALSEAVEQAREAGRPGESAAGVVLDVNSGAVVAMASYPTYEPSIWTTGVSSQQYEELLDPTGGQPLRNRALAETFAPASTFKAISLTAALRQGIDPQRQYECPGSVQIGDRRFTNFESRDLGSVDAREALEVSCDTVFYRWAEQNWRDIGGISQEADLRDPYILMAQDYGLGDLTGVDVPGEAAGLVPGREWKRQNWQATREETCAQAEQGYPDIQDRQEREYLEQLAEENCESGWQYRVGDAVNLSIGQGALSVTPLQMAVSYAAIANGGTLWQPQVAAGLAHQDGDLVEEFEPQSSGEVGLLPQELEILRDGLLAVNRSGTGAAAFSGFDLDSYPVAGKTGSAEAYGQRSSAWYASFGPVNDPQYAVVVMVEQGGIGGEVAAPAARKIWDALSQ